MDGVKGWTYLEVGVKSVVFQSYFVSNQTMCDTEEGPTHFPSPRSVKPGLCVKCKHSVPSVLVRNIGYCQPCFIDTTIHRFRSQFIKTSIVAKPRVLVAVSGYSSN